MIFYKSKTKAEWWLYIEKKLFNILSDITKLSKSIKYTLFYIYNYVYIFLFSISILKSNSNLILINISY